jgi:hypothetical protein
MDKLKSLMNEYGPIAVVVYFVIFFAVWAGFSTAISMGVNVAWGATSAAAAGTAGTAGAWTLGYFATKVTQPLRIIATLAVTPFMAKLWKRVRKSPAATEPAAPPK